MAIVWYCLPHNYMTPLVEIRANGRYHLLVASGGGTEIAISATPISHRADGSRGHASVAQWMSNRVLSDSYAGSIPVGGTI
jgi:hypothetical protein